MQATLLKSKEEPFEGLVPCIWCYQPIDTSDPTQVALQTCHACLNPLPSD